MSDSLASDPLGNILPSQKRELGTEIKELFSNSESKASEKPNVACLDTDLQYRQS